MVFLNFRVAQASRSSCSITLAQFGTDWSVCPHILEYYVPQFRGQRHELVCRPAMT